MNKLDITYEFEYLNVLTENEITVSDLPQELQDKVTAIEKKYKGLNLPLSRYNKTPTDGLKNQVENGLKEVTKLDLELAQEIIDHLEKDLPEPKPSNPPIINTNNPLNQTEPMQTEPTPAAGTTEPAPAAPTAAATPQPAPPTPEPTPAAGTTEPAPADDEDAKEKAVLAALNKDKRITVKALAAILGHTPTHPKMEKVGKISLRGVAFNSNEYILI